MFYQYCDKLYCVVQLALEADMAPFEVSDPAEAVFLREEHGERIELFSESDGRLMAKLKSGAVIYVPKRGKCDRGVAGQLPSLWSLERLYGIDPQLAAQIDPVTHYGLAATMEAFASAGIEDPYEVCTFRLLPVFQTKETPYNNHSIFLQLYQYLHVSEVGNTVGGGMGGMKALKDVFQRRMLESPSVSSDVLQETFINTSAAWINMVRFFVFSPSSSLSLSPPLNV